MNKRNFVAFAAILTLGITVAAAVYFSGIFPAGAASATTACTDCAHGEHDADHAEAAETGHETEADPHAHEGHIVLSEAAISLFGIEMAQAGPGKIGLSTTLPAEIAMNEDKKAHVVPRIPGVVHSVARTLGDTVAAGEVLAVLHSRELADYKAAYLAGREKLALAETMYDREKNLWEKKIAAEQDYLKAASEAADARIGLRSAEQKLHALGFSQEYLEHLPEAPEESYIIYEIAAPIDGTIVEKHITRGEVLREDSLPFVIADLRDVWVNIHIHQKDLPHVRPGQQAVVKTEHEQDEGIIGYISPVVKEATRTVLARITLPNDSGRWRPGRFAMADICLEERDGKVVVPNEAIVTHEGLSLVFVPAEEGFRPQPVEVGRNNEEWAEIVSGLEPGQNYVARGAFTLKSEMTKSTEDPCGGH